MRKCNFCQMMGDNEAFLISHQNRVHGADYDKHLAKGGAKTKAATDKDIADLAARKAARA